MWFLFGEVSSSSGCLGWDALFKLLWHFLGLLYNFLNIDNPYFEGMVNQIYPPELQLNKANTSDTETPFLDSHLSISN